MGLSSLLNTVPKLLRHWLLVLALFSAKLRWEKVSTLGWSQGFFLSLSLSLFFFFFISPTEQDRRLTTVSILLISWNLGLWVWEIQDQISAQMHSAEGCNPSSHTCELSWPLGYLKQQHSCDLGKSQTKKQRQWKVHSKFIWSSTELWCWQIIF